MRRFALPFVLALLVAACGPFPGPVPPGPETADASPPVHLDGAPEPSDRCSRSFLHLLEVGCTPKPPASGAWVDVCRNARLHGAFPLDGIDKTTTLAEARRAGVDCWP